MPGEQVVEYEIFSEIEKNTTYLIDRSISPWSDEHDTMLLSSIPLKNHEIASDTKEPHPF
jgi:hypothetical protein